MKMHDGHPAERDMRQLLADGGLPQPDTVEYRETEVAFFWNETKTVVIVDLTQPPGDR